MATVEDPGHLRFGFIINSEAAFQQLRSYCLDSEGAYNLESRAHNGMATLDFYAESESLLHEGMVSTENPQIRIVITDVAR